MEGSHRPTPAAGSSSAPASSAGGPTPAAGSTAPSRYAIEALGTAWKIVPDNFGLTIRGDDVTAHAFWRAPGAPGRPRDLGERQALARRRRDPPQLPPQQVSAPHAALGRARGRGLLPPRRRRRLALALRRPSGSRADDLNARLRPRRRADPAGAGAPHGPRGPSKRPADPPRRVPTRPLDHQRQRAGRALRGPPRRPPTSASTSRRRSRAVPSAWSRWPPTRRPTSLDALELSDLGPSPTSSATPRSSRSSTTRPFERSVLGRYGVPIAGIVDTLRVSRKLRGTKIDGGHSLKRRLRPRARDRARQVRAGQRLVPAAAHRAPGGLRGPGRRGAAAALRALRAAGDDRGGERTLAVGN